MAYYTIDDSHTAPSSHSFLLAPPLIVISVFCFGYMMMHSPGAGNGHDTSSSRSSPSAVDPETNLPPITLAPQESLSTISDVPAYGAADVNNISSGNPQSANTQTTIDPAKKISVSKSQATSLTNNLKTR